MKRNGDGGCVWEREVFGILVQGRREGGLRRGIGWIY